MKLGGDPQRVNPLAPAELVIDHSVQVDEYGSVELPRAQQPDRVQSQRRTLYVFALGPDRLQQFQSRAAQHRHRASGQPRAPCARRVRGGVGHPTARFPRYARRNRFSHHHDQRARRARLGCRRHRGRGRDARSTGDHAHSTGDRLQAHRQSARRHHRDGSRAHGDRNPAQERRRRQVRRILRRRPQRLAARRPRDHRQHVAGVRLDLRYFPDRRGDRALSRAHRPPQGADRARRGVREGPGNVARRRRESRRLHRCGRARSRPRRACARRPEATRRIGCRCAPRKACSAAA